MLVQCGIPTHINNHFYFRKIQNRAGVVAGTTVIVTHGLSPLVNVVVSSIGHPFLHNVSTIVTIYMIYSNVTFSYCLFSIILRFPTLPLPLFAM